MTTRVALVTGGTGGIGTAICRHLATLGHKVATNYRDEAKAKAWQDAQRKEGFDFALAKGDVADAATAEGMVREVEKQLGPIDILINNAGITRDTTFHKMNALQWQEVINTNLNSVFNVTRPVIEGMTLAERRDQRRDDLAAEARRRRDAQVSARRPVAQLAHIFERLHDAFHARLAILVEELAFARQRRRARRALEEPRAELTLELLDAPTHGGARRCRVSRRSYGRQRSRREAIDPDADDRVRLAALCARACR